MTPYSLCIPFRRNPVAVFPVIMARRKHPFPFRTRPLSFSAAMVLRRWSWESSTLPGLFRKGRFRFCGDGLFYALPQNRTHVTIPIVHHSRRRYHPPKWTGKRRDKNGVNTISLSLSPSTVSRSSTRRVGRERACSGGRSSATPQGFPRASGTHPHVAPSRLVGEPSTEKLVHENGDANGGRVETIPKKIIKTVAMRRMYC